MASPAIRFFVSTKEKGPARNRPQVEMLLSVSIARVAERRGSQVGSFGPKRCQNGSVSSDDRAAKAPVQAGADHVEFGRCGGARPAGAGARSDLAVGQRTEIDVKIFEL